MINNLNYSLIAFISLITVSIANGQQKQSIINYLNGKKFYALLGEGCAETSGGDFMISDHCVLVFTENELIIKQYENNDRSYKRKQEPQKAETRKYELKHDTISIEDYPYLQLYIDTSNNKLNVFTHYGIVTPSKKRIYFTELKKETKTFFAQAPY